MLLGQIVWHTCGQTQSYSGGLRRRWAEWQVLQLHWFDGGSFLVYDGVLSWCTLADQLG